MKSKLPYILALLSVACTDEVNDVHSDSLSSITFGVGYETMSRTESESSASVGSFNLGDISDSVSVALTTEDFAAVEPSGRAAPVQQINSFRAWAFLYEGESATGSFFANEAVSDKGTYWSTTQPYYWPTSANQRLSFTAVSNVTEDMAVDALTQTISLSYTVPAAAAAQTDILLAQTEPINYNTTPDTPVALNFKHICAGVRFRAGTSLMPGTIQKITLRGVRDTGVFSGGTWTLADNISSFSLDTPVEVSGSTASDTELYQTYQTFMFLPQTLGPDARLEVEFADRTTGTTRTLSASLDGQQWPIGKITTYHIGITPGYHLEFTSTPPVQDANYVMCNTTFSAIGLASATAWTLTASASDGADVSIQRESEVNEYAKQGFWLDKKMNNGTVTTESARGSSVISGSGNVWNLDVRVFLPENIGDAARTVTLRLHVDGTPASADVAQSITQLSPAWAGNVGWEQIDDHQTGIYGFCYTARHVYVYNNSHTIVPANNVVSQVQQLVTQYSAGDYASVTRYNQNLVSYRNYVDIDYRKLNKLEGRAESQDNGLQNTHELFNFGGTALSRNFENAIIAMRRVNDASNAAYRKRADNDPSSVPQWIDGTEINNSQILALVLKKNRYYLNTATVDDNTTVTPLIRSTDIEWYLPASGQFGNAPAWYDGSAMVGADFWSSTAPSENYAYTGSGAAIVRSLTRSVRVVRNRP